MTRRQITPRPYFTTHGTIRSAAAFAVLCGLAAAGCDNQDIAGPETLVLAAGDEAVTRAFEHPYLGRLAIDYGLTNGPAQGVFDIRVQAQTSGALDELACEEGVTSAARTLTAVSADASADTLRDRDRAHFIDVPAALTGGGFIDVRIPTTSTWRIFTSEAAEQLALASSDGTTIAPEQSLQVSECSLFSTMLEYSLTDGTYALQVITDGAVVLLEEACESTRTVAATCPGGARDLFETDPIGLDADGFISGRIHSYELGIGDRSVVEISCNALTPNCSGELEIFFVAETLECRTDLDCSNAEVCQSEGYCQRVRTGCATSAPQSPAPAWLAAAALALLRRRGHTA